MNVFAEYGQVVLGGIGIIWGLMIVASGQLFLAIRETALNTRKVESKGDSNYGVLMAIAKANNLLGWIVVVLSLLIMVLGITNPGESLHTNSLF